MNEAIRHFVRDRAAGRCEYCRLSQTFHDLPFQVEHIIAKKHKGDDDAANLAFSCYNCNAYKGPNIAGIDPQTQQLTRLFHPRTDRWEDHFSWVGPELIGLTDVGRTTIEVLRMNQEENLALRRLLIALGETF
jgi:hypothetical protein